MAKLTIIIILILVVCVSLRARLCGMGSSLPHVESFGSLFLPLPAAASCVWLLRPHRWQPAKASHPWDPGKHRNGLPFSSPFYESERQIVFEGRFSSLNHQEKILPLIFERQARVQRTSGSAILQSEKSLFSFVNSITTGNCGSVRFHSIHKRSWIIFYLSLLISVPISTKISTVGHKHHPIYMSSHLLIAHLVSFHATNM